MTAEEMFEKYGDEEYLKFDRIPSDKRLAESAKICGFFYIYKLMKDPKMFLMAAEHDDISLAHLEDLRDLTEEDIIYLSRCGIRYDDEFECLAAFV